MKRIRLLLLLPFLVGCAQVTNIPPSEEPVETAIPTIGPTETSTPECDNFQINPQKVQGQLSIEIALPAEYGDFPDEEYNSIYLLDANYFFDDEEGSLDYLLERGDGMTQIVQTLTEDGKIPPSVLIGIGYSEGQRTNFTQFDVTNFYTFFTEELIPEIEARCQVSKTGKDRVLFGYSASAHFSTYVLLQDVYTGAETFNKFISISGVYDSNQKITELEENLFDELGATSFSGRSLFMAIGENDPKSSILDAHRLFAATLTSRGYADFNLYITEFPNKGHYDIPEFAFTEGLIWVFSE